MSGIKKPDYLSSLPSELLQQIYDLAAIPKRFSSRSKFLLGPPSRKLRPFFDRSFYSNVSLESGRQTQHFCILVPEQSLQLVRSFSINLPCRAVGLDYKTVEIGEDVHWPNNKLLVETLEKLTSVERVYINGSSRFASLFLSSTYAIPALPTLSSLTLKSSFLGLEDPFDPRHYISLSSYPSLRTLQVSLWPDRLITSSSYDQSASRPPLSLPTITAVDLGGPLLTSPHISALLKSFPNLSKLFLRDRSAKPGFFDLLQAVAKPELLEELSLRCWDFDFDNATSAATSPQAIFSRFSNLRSLAVNLELSPSLYRLLCSLRTLQHLEIGIGLEVSEREITRVIDSLDLRTLILNSPDAHLNSQFWDPNNKYRSLSDSEDEEEDLEWMFEFAEWTDKLSKEGLKRLMTKCEERKIQLTGLACRALVLEKKWESGELRRERIRWLEEMENAENQFSRMMKIQEEGVVGDE
ncbi:hypothetical protein JCM5350_003653 [Sporobolomyces pararoseus]